MASEPAARTIAAGRVGRAHGLDGSFYVTQPVARLLALQAPVTVAGDARTIVRRAGTESRPILRLEGMRCREDAEALRGATLSLPIDAGTGARAGGVLVARTRGLRRLRSGTARSAPCTA